MITCTQHPKGTLCARRLGKEMRPRYGGDPNAWPHLLTDQRHSPPLPMIYTVKCREQSEANYPGERNGGKRLGGEGTPEGVCPPPLPRRQRSPPIKTTFLEDAMIHIDIDTSPAPTKYCQHLATHRDPHHTHTLLESPLLTGTQPLIIIPSLPHNTYSPWQPPEDHSCSPSSLPGAALHDAPHHSHTT